MVDGKRSILAMALVYERTGFSNYVYKLHVLHLCTLIRTELWNGKYHEILHSIKKLVRQIVKHGIKW